MEFRLGALMPDTLSAATQRRIEEVERRMEGGASARTDGDGPREAAMTGHVAGPGAMILDFRRADLTGATIHLHLHPAPITE